MHTSPLRNDRPNFRLEVRLDDEPPEKFLEPRSNESHEQSESFRERQFFIRRESQEQGRRVLRLLQRLNTPESICSRRTALFPVISGALDECESSQKTLRAGEKSGWCRTKARICNRRREPFECVSACRDFLPVFDGAGGCDCRRSGCGDNSRNPTLD